MGIAWTPCSSVRVGVAHRWYRSSYYIVETLCTSQLNAVHVGITQSNWFHDAHRETPGSHWPGVLCV
jgi:hypothetical protein